MFNSIIEDDYYITVIPGTDLHIRKKATANNFASKSKIIEVEDRPTVPVEYYKPDYVKEITLQEAPPNFQLSSGIRFDQTELEPRRDDNRFNLVPGRIYYYRMLATETSFKTAPQSFNLENRLVTNISLGIDFQKESTEQIH